MNAGTVDIDDVNVSKSFAVNGSFSDGWGPWQSEPDTNYIDYSNGQQKLLENSRNGTNYGAVNTSESGGGIYQDITGLTINPGDTYCASAFVRTQYPGTGANGIFALWMTDNKIEGSQISFGNLGNPTIGRAVQTCMTASVAHSDLRIQLYPGVNAGTVDIDDVNVSKSFAVNGSFSDGWGPWQSEPDTNYIDYSNGQQNLLENSRDGTNYGAVNTSESGGGIYQDITGLTINPGDTYCASAFVRTQYPGTGANGIFALWMTDNKIEGSQISFGNLGNLNNWTPVQTCMTASVAHSDLRIQLYPGVNAGTVDIDDVSTGLGLDESSPQFISSGQASMSTGIGGSFTVTATGSPTPSFSESGSLPTGVTFTDNGDGTATLSGTPSEAGSFPITVAASNGVFPDATQSLTLSVDQVPNLTAPATATFVEANANSLAMSATGYPTPSFSESGTLPSGVSLTDNGNGSATISGTPTQSGAFPITVTASNGVSPDASASMTLTVVPLEVTTTSLPAATKKSAYNATLAAEGGATPYKWTLAKGSVLPPGLSLSSGGAISGKPTKVGVFTFSVKVTSTKTQTFPKDSASATLSIVVGK